MVTRSQEREETDIWVCVCLGEIACLCLYAYVFVHVYLFAYELCLQMSEGNSLEIDADRMCWKLQDLLHKLNSHEDDVVPCCAAAVFLDI